MFTWLQTKLEKWCESAEGRWWMSKDRQTELVCDDCGKRIRVGRASSPPTKVHVVGLAVRYGACRVSPNQA